jgi:hypothetical protein
VPNIEDEATKIPFIITTILVGVVTYAIVFNMDHVQKNLRKFYVPRMKSLVDQMQNEEDWWTQKGYEFEELKPSDEMKTPSEWWIPEYAIRLLFQKILERLDANKPDTTSNAI